MRHDDPGIWDGFGKELHRYELDRHGETYWIPRLFVGGIRSGNMSAELGWERTRRDKGWWLSSLHCIANPVRRQKSMYLGVHVRD